MTSRQLDQSTEFGLPADLGIANAEALKALLLDWVNRPGAISIQAPRVDRLHTASLQLLAAFAKSRQQAGQPWTWGEVASSLRQAADRLGLSQLLQMKEDRAEQKETH